MAETRQIQIALSALSNSSRTPVTEDDVVNILRTGVGPANLTRALFEDCSLSVLMEIALSLGMTQRDLVHAYSNAKSCYPIVNEEIDELIYGDAAK